MEFERDFAFAELDCRHDYDLGWGCQTHHESVTL